MSGSAPNAARRDRSPRLHPRPLDGAVRVAVRRAQAVALAVVVAGGLDVAGQRGAEAGEPGADGLEPDRVGAPDRHQRRVLQARRRAVHDERARRRAGPTRRRARSRRAATLLDVPQAHDVLDRAQQVELPRGEGGGPGHRRARPRRSMRSITPAASRRRKRSSSDVGVGGRRHRVRRQPDGDDRVGLHHRAVEHPRIAGPDPHDPVGLDAVAQQPHDRVGGGLARADDHVAARRLGEVGQLVDRDDADAVGHPERRRRRRRDRGRQVGGVDDPAPHVDLARSRRTPAR